MSRQKRPARRPATVRKGTAGTRAAATRSSQNKRARTGRGSDGPSLSLPVIPPAQSAREALRLMHEYGRSGVLSYIGGWRLYDAAHVVIALADDPAAPLTAVPANSIAGAVRRDGAVAVLDTTGITFEVRRRTRRGVSPATGVALPGIDRERAQVLAAGPRDCYCRVDLKPVAGGRSGGDCPKGHRGSVRCV